MPSVRSGTLPSTACAPRPVITVGTSAFSIALASPVKSFLGCSQFAAAITIPSQSRRTLGTLTVRRSVFVVVLTSRRTEEENM